MFTLLPAMHTCFLLYSISLWTETLVTNHSTDISQFSSVAQPSPGLCDAMDWKIPWAEEPGRLQSMGSLRVGYDRATSLSCVGEGNGNPLQCSCLENPRDRGAWWAAVYGVAQSRTRLKRLSSSRTAARQAPLCPSPTAGACSDSCPSS